MGAIAEMVGNRRSRRKYDEFVSAMGQVSIVLEEVRRVIGKLDPEALPAGRRSWSVEELLDHCGRAERSLDALESKSRRYQAELVSFEWRA